MCTLHPANMIWKSHTGIPIRKWLCVFAFVNVNFGLFELAPRCLTGPTIHIRIYVYTRMRELAGLPKVNSVDIRNGRGIYEKLIRNPAISINRRPKIIFAKFGTLATNIISFAQTQLPIYIHNRYWNSNSSRSQLKIGTPLLDPKPSADARLNKLRRPPGCNSFEKFAYTRTI